MPHRSQSRRGMTLFWVVGLASVLMIVVSLTASYCVTLVRSQQQQDQRQQANLLADAALRKALTMLTQRPDYAGETWTLESASSGLSYPATMNIKVTSDEKVRQRRLIAITASYGQSPAMATIVHREFSTTIQEPPR